VVASILPTIGMAEERSEVEEIFTPASGGKALRLAGDLTKGVALRVSALLTAHPPVERIELSSDGRAPPDQAHRALE
jgi:hypothetical protein